MEVGRRTPTRNLKGTPTMSTRKAVSRSDAPAEAATEQVEQVEQAPEPAAQVEPEQEPEPEPEQEEEPEPEPFTLDELEKRYDEIVASAEGTDLMAGRLAFDVKQRRISGDKSKGEALLSRCSLDLEERGVKYGKTRLSQLSTAYDSLLKMGIEPTAELLSKTDRLTRAGSAAYREEVIPLVADVTDATEKVAALLSAAEPKKMAAAKKSADAKKAAVVLTPAQEKARADAKAAREQAKRPQTAAAWVKALEDLLTPTHLPTDVGEKHFEAVSDLLATARATRVDAQKAEKASA